MTKVTSKYRSEAWALKKRDSKIIDGIQTSFLRPLLSVTILYNQRSTNRKRLNTLNIITETEE